MDSVAPNIIVNPERFELAIHANEDCTFELTNVGYDAVIYRVRTTAPLRYYLKHSKGVVRGNSSAKVTIFLNRKNFAEGAEPGQRFTKDTFRVECAVLGEQDVVEAHCANIANLIQKKKDVNPAAVVQKHVYCRVMMEPETTPKDSTTAVSANAAGRTSAAHNASERSGAAGGSAAGDDAGAEGGGSRKSMTVHQVVENTLKEKHRRSDGGQSVVRGGHTALIRIGVVSALVLVFAIWMMSGGSAAVAEDISA